jgi:hypothetical protein
MVVCVFIAFSLRQESPNMILGDEPLISEVALSHQLFVPLGRNFFLLHYVAMNPKL